MRGAISSGKRMHAPPHSSSWFQQFALRASDLVGSHGAFLLAATIVLIWAVSGPLFDYSDTWQLWINTGTTIVTFLMVFLIQYTQNRDAKSMHLKLDELLRALKGTHPEMINLRDLSDEEIHKLEEAFDRLARFAARARSMHATGAAAASERHTVSIMDVGPNETEEKLE